MVFLLLLLICVSLRGLAQEVVDLKLNNGLQVLLQEVHTSQLVSVWCFYKVGSRDEVPGSTGISHYLEHMNFKGTTHFTREEVKGLIEKYGGDWNGYTSYDYTCYFETLPKEALELALAIEADRMQNTLIDEKEFQKERTVVLSELHGDENSPLEFLAREVQASAFLVHPYHYPVIGWQNDVEKITHEEMLNYYHTYYVPNNATLVVSGNFDRQNALNLIRRYFGSIPAGNPVKRKEFIEPPQQGERRIKVERPGTTYYLLVAYHSPSINSRDTASLLVLDAILAGAKGINTWSIDEWEAKKSSLLYRELIATEVASDVVTFFLPTKDPGLYKFYVTLRNGHKPLEAEEKLFSLLEKIKTVGVTQQELDKAKKQLKAVLVFQAETVTEKAHQLGYLATISSFEREKELFKEIAQVSITDIQKVANDYLTEKNRTVGWFIPEKEGSSEGETCNKQILAFPRVFYKYQDNIKESNFTLPPPELKFERKTLPNGMTLILQKNSSTPLVAIRVSIKGGSGVDPKGKEGLANLLASSLDRGTKKFSFSQISEGFDSLGATLDIFANKEEIVITSKALSSDIKEILTFLEQLLTSPTFPEDEINKVKGEILTKIEEENDNPSSVIMKKFYQTLYPPNHPYHNPVIGEKESVIKLTSEDLINYHKLYFNPKNIILTVSGDINEKEIYNFIKELMGKWEAKAPSPQLPLEEPVNAKAEKVIIPMAGKAQTEIVIGFPCIKRSDPDYFHLRVLADILGQFGMGGLLGRDIREDKGLAYSVYATFVPGMWQGPFIIRCGVAPEKRDEAIAEVKKVLEDFQEKGPTLDALQNSKQYVINSLATNLETQENVARLLCNIEFYKLGRNYLKDFVKEVNSTTKEDIKETARKYLYPEKSVIIVAEPK